MTAPSRVNAPPPDLRIVPTHTLLAHEDHDSQRSAPLMARLQAETVMINPPVVAPLPTTDEERYVILDGANRCFALAALGVPHVLVQCVSYAAGTVSLDTWHHVVCGWPLAAFHDALGTLNSVDVVHGTHKDAIAHVVGTDDQAYALLAPVETTHARNATLRDVVQLYQRAGVLQRTASNEPHEVWPLFPDATALVLFPAYQPADILAAAQHQAFLPPGISRHIVHGRALRVNYPLAWLRADAPLEAKRAQLHTWLQQKMAARHVRFYAEATYQFDE